MKLSFEESCGFLECPICKGDYIHQGDVYSLRNIEDYIGSHPLMTKLDGKESNGFINPLIKMPFRGDSIMIEFLCESCDLVSYLYISHHKGNTHIQFITHGQTT